MKKIDGLSLPKRNPNAFDSPTSVLSICGPGEHGFSERVVCVLSSECSYGEEIHGDADVLLDADGVLKLISELQSLLLEAGHKIPKQIDERTLCRQTKPRPNTDL